MLLALACTAATLAVPAISDFLPLAAITVAASLFLLLQALFRRRGRPGTAAPNWLIVDGSNVMHWRDGTPQIDTLCMVLRRLETLQFVPGVVFDANAGYLIAGRYQHDRALGRLIGLSEDRVMVVPKGTPADQFILMAARNLGARVVTNDRYRDWADAHPEVREPGHLVRGGFRGDALWLDLPGCNDAPAAPLAASGR